MRKLTIAAAVIGVLGFSSVSNAESYVSAYLGMAIPHDADVTSPLAPGASATVEFDSGFALGAKIGHWFNDMPHFGVQLDLNGHYPDLKSFSELGLTVPITGDVSVNSITANALLRMPEGKIRPYVGVGAGFFMAEVDSPDLLLNDDKDTAFGWQLLAGVDFDVAPKFSIFGEYKYSMADFTFTPLDVEYSVSQIYGGVSYHF
jgi:opacity protein-like surface antigen